MRKGGQVRNFYMLTRLPAEECKLQRTSHENNRGKQSILVNKTCIHEYVEMQEQRKTNIQRQRACQKQKEWRENNMKYTDPARQNSTYKGKR